MTFADTLAPPSPLRRALARPGIGRVSLFVALFACALMPTATTPIPAMVDYVNHLARMHELAAPSSPFYQADWKLYPNLAMDLVVPALARLTGVDAATRLFLLASQVLVVSGSVAIEWRVQRRFGAAGFVALAYLYNVPFAWGFLNFEFACGLALWGIAAWLAVRKAAWPIRLAVHASFVVALFAGHMFALGLYGATLGLHEIWAAHQTARAKERWMRRLLGTAVLLAGPTLVLAVLMGATGGSVGGSFNAYNFAAKPLWPFEVMNGDDAHVAMVGTLLLAWLAGDMVRRGEIAFVASGAWLLAGLGALYLAMPAIFLDTAFVDIRVLVGIVLIVPAFVSVDFADARRAAVAACVVAAVTILNAGCVELVWQSYQPIYRDMFQSFGRLSPHARVLAAHTGPEHDPPLRWSDYPLYHAPTLAVPYAGAFVPTLFTTKGKQPLTVGPGLERLSNSCGGPVPLSLLRNIASGATRGIGPAAFVADWTKDFDYVYLLGDPTGEPVPDALEPIESRRGFVLYRVRKTKRDGSKLSGPASP